MTACVAHNICIINHDEFEEILTEDQVQQHYANVQNYNAADQEDAAIKRLNIAHGLLNYDFVTW